MRKLNPQFLLTLTLEQIKTFEKIDFNTAYLNSNILFEQYKFKLFRGNKKVPRLYLLGGFQSKRKFLKHQLAEFESRIQDKFTDIWVQVEPHSKGDDDEFYHQILYPECIALEIYQENLLLILDQFANELLVEGVIELKSFEKLNYVGCSFDNLQLLNSKEE